MQELWNNIKQFMTGEAFKIAEFPVLWWYVIVAAAAVVVLVIVITIAVACSKKKKKKKAMQNGQEANQSSTPIEQKSDAQVFKEVTPDWQPTVQNPENTGENTSVVAETETTEEAIVEDSTPQEEIVEAEPIPAPVQSVKAESVPTPVKKEKAEPIPAPVKKVKAETVPAPVKTAPVVEEVKQEEPVPIKENEVAEVIEETPVELAPIVEEQPVQEVKEEKVVVYQAPTPIKEEKTSETEVAATTAPRSLPKKTNKTTKKTAEQIANEIEVKTGSNPRKKSAGDKPAVVGKDKLPKKSTKAKKEEEAPKETKSAPQNNNPDELPLITTDPNVESFGKFVIVKNDDNSTRPYHFRLLANNGQILFESESYKSKPRSNSIIAFKKAAVEENFEIDVDKANNWRYKLYNSAHTVIGVGESYSTRQGCENSVQSVIKFAESARFLEDQSEN